MAELVTIASADLSAAINPIGAELTHLRDSRGRELMTNADPAFWTGHAPVLFPVVGRLNGDSYRLGDTRYPMPKHGFARHATFAVVEQAADRATFRLVDDDATRAQFPFAFALDLTFVIEGATLTMAASVTNRDTQLMPASFGFHPAFAWPLPYGRPRSDHRIDFAADEPGRLSAISPDGLIARTTLDSPLAGRQLMLRDSLFEDDALVWSSVESRQLRYGASSGPALDIGFPDTPMLGIWSKPGAAYVCVEPWHGIADPEGFDGDIFDKPGIIAFAPGEARQFTMQVTLVP